MAKTRELDREFWDDTVIDSMSRDERLLAVAMITLLADDEGRFVAEPTVIKKRVFGLDKDMTPARVEAMLRSMAKAWKNFRLYSVENQTYGVLLKFSEKQGIRYVVKSKLPAYDKSFDLNDCGNLPEISADSPRVGLSRVEKSRVDGAENQRRKSAKDQVEDLVVDDELRAYARKHGQNADDLIEEWRLHFRGNGYKTTAGPVADARATFMAWIRRAKKFTPKSSGSLFNQQPRRVAMRDEE